jgi:hypothetical protein
MAATTDKMTELFEQTADTFDTAVKNGIRFQEEAMRWWTDAFRGTGTLQEWQQETQAVVSQAAPAAQKSMQDYMEAFTDSARSNLDVLQKAFDAGRSSSPSELQNKTHELWEASLVALRTNAQKMMEANARAMQAWSGIARRSAENLTATGTRAAEAGARTASSAAKSASRKSKSKRSK